MSGAKENTRGDELFDLSPPSSVARRAVKLDSSTPTTPVFTSSYRGSTPTRRHGRHITAIRAAAISGEDDRSSSNLSLPLMRSRINSSDTLVVSACTSRKADVTTILPSAYITRRAQCAVDSDMSIVGIDAKSHTPPRATPTRRPVSPTRVETPPRVPASRFGQTWHAVQEKKEVGGRGVGIHATDRNTFLGSSTSGSFVYFNSGDGHHFIGGGSPRRRLDSPSLSTSHRKTLPYCRGEGETHHDHYNYVFTDVVKAAPTTPNSTTTVPSEVRRGQQQKPGYGNVEENNIHTRGAEKEASSQPKGEYCSSSNEADGRDEMQIVPSLNVSPIRGSPQRRGSLADESNARGNTSSHASPGGKLNSRGVGVGDLQRPTSPINPILTQLRSSVMGSTEGSRWASKYEILTRAPSLPSPLRRAEPDVLAMSSTEPQECQTKSEGVQDGPNARTPQSTKKYTDTVNYEGDSSFPIKSALHQKRTPSSSAIRSAAVVHYPNTSLYSNNSTNVFGSDLFEEARRSGLLPSPSSSKRGIGGRDASQRGAGTSAASSTISPTSQKPTHIVNNGPRAGKIVDAKGKAKSCDDDDDIKVQAENKSNEERSPSPIPLSTREAGRGTTTMSTKSSGSARRPTSERTSPSLVIGEGQGTCRLVRFSTTKTTATKSAQEEKEEQVRGESEKERGGRRVPSTESSGEKKTTKKKINGVEDTIRRIECFTQNSNKTATQIEESLLLIMSANLKGQVPQSTVAAVPPHSHTQLGFGEEDNGGGLSVGTIDSSQQLHGISGGVEGRKKSGTVRRVYTVGVGLTTVPAHLPTSVSSGDEVSVVPTRRGIGETDKGVSVGGSRRSLVVKLESRVNEDTIGEDQKAINEAHDHIPPVMGGLSKKITSLPDSEEQHKHEEAKKAITANKAGHPAEHAKSDHYDGEVIEGRRRGRDDVSSSKLAKIVAAVSSTSSRAASPPSLSTARRSSSSTATVNESGWRKAGRAKEVGRESSTATGADGTARANKPKRTGFPPGSRSPSPRGTSVGKTTSTKQLSTTPSPSRSRSQQQQHAKRQNTDRSSTSGKTVAQRYDEETSQIKTTQHAERRRQKYARVGALVGSSITKNASSSPPSPLEQTLAQHQQHQEKEDELIMMIGARKEVGDTDINCAESNQEHSLAGNESPPPTAMYERVSLLDENEADYRSLSVSQSAATSRAATPRHPASSVPQPPMSGDSFIDTNTNHIYMSGGDSKRGSVRAARRTESSGNVRQQGDTFVAAPAAESVASTSDLYTKGQSVAAAAVVPRLSTAGQMSVGPVGGRGNSGDPTGAVPIPFPLSAAVSAGYGPAGGFDYSRTTTANYLNFSRAVSAVAEGSDAAGPSCAPTPTLFIDSLVSPPPPPLATYNANNAESSSVTSVRPKPLRGVSTLAIEESSRSYNKNAEKQDRTQRHRHQDPSTLDTMKPQPVDDASLVPRTAFTSQPRISTSTTPVPFPSSCAPVPHAALTVSGGGASQFERDASVPPQPSSSEPPRPMPSPTRRMPRYDAKKTYASTPTSTSELTAAERDDIGSIALPLQSSSSSQPILASHQATVRTAPPSPRVRCSLSSSSILTPNSHQLKASEKNSKRQEGRYESGADNTEMNPNKNTAKEKEDVGRGGVASFPLRSAITSPKRMSNTVPSPPSTVKALRSPRDDNGSDRGLLVEEEEEKDCKQGISDRDSEDKVGHHPIRAAYATCASSSSRWSAGVSRDVEGGNRKLKLGTNTPLRSSANSSLLSSSSSFHVRHSDTTTHAEGEKATVGNNSAQSNRSSPLRLHHGGTLNAHAHTNSNTRAPAANTTRRTTSNRLSSAAAATEDGGDLSLRNVLEEAARLKAMRANGSAGTPSGGAIRGVGSDTGGGGEGLEEYLSLTRLEPLSPNRRSSPNFRVERHLPSKNARIGGQQQVHQHQTASTPSTQQSSLSSLEERLTHVTLSKNAYGSKGRAVAGENAANGIDRNNTPATRIRSTLDASAESRERSVNSDLAQQKASYARTTASAKDSSGAETRWRRVAGADVPTPVVAPRIVGSEGISSDSTDHAVRPVPVKISLPTTEEQKSENRRYDPVRGSPLRWGAAIGQRQTHSLPSKLSNRWSSALLDEAETENKHKGGGEVWNANSQSLPAARTRWSSNK